MFEQRRRHRSVKFYLAWANIVFWGTLALIFIFAWLMRFANDPRRIAQFASHTAVPGISSDPIGVIIGNAEAVLSPPAATAAPPEVPPKPADPTPRLEPSPDTSAEVPAATALPQPEATAGIFDNQPAVPVFNMQVVENSGDIGGDAKGCIEGHVVLQRGVTQVMVLFKQENVFVSADVDSNGYYRKCDLAGGLWEATIDTLGGTAFTGASYQAVQVVEGQVSNVSWYEK